MLIGLYVIILAVLGISAVLGIAIAVMGVWDIFIEKRRTGWQWFSLVGGVLVVAIAAPLIIYFFSLSREEFESNLNRVKGDGVRVVYPDTKKADASPPF